MKNTMMSVSAAEPVEQCCCLGDAESPLGGRSITARLATAAPGSVSRPGNGARTAGTTLGVADRFERARLEAQLRESEERFRGAFEAAAIGMAIVGLDGRWIQVNQALRDIVGYSEAELLTRSFMVITHPDDLAADLELLERLRAGEIRNYQLDKRYLHRDGHIVWGRLTVSLVRDGQGAPLYFVSQVLDISEQRRAEAELAARTKRLEEKTREQEAFLYTISHDLKTPMVSVRGFADLLLEDYSAQLDDEARLYLERIDANVIRMHALLDDLLALSRVGKTEPDCTWVDLGEVAIELLDHLQPRIAAHGATVELSEPLPVIWGNATRIEEALQNLIVNAITYTPAGRAPDVVIRCATTPAGWRISVSDNGIGIAEGDRERVLSLFQRLPEGKALNPEGTGAGLAIVARIVEVHGGSIAIDDAPEGGTTISIDLPRP